MNHEEIHGRQQKEMLVLLFYVWYFVEWLVRLALYRNFKDAYRNISFEQEAYIFENDPFYEFDRKHYAWLKFLTKKTFKR